MDGRDKPGHDAERVSLIFDFLDSGKKGSLFLPCPALVGLRGAKLALTESAEGLLQQARRV
jgi:hypothetical protein